MGATTRPAAASLQSSASESPSVAAFARLHPVVQRWVYDQGWSTLHDVQVEAVDHVLSGGGDIVLAAPTSAGKTEAAFLPLVSLAAAARDDRRTAGRVVYVSPLKALINDQFDRLTDLCARADIAVARWHGDVSAHVKLKALTDPPGVLLITPESLEALFVNRPGEMRGLLAGLRWIVVDELHSFLATPRGAQLQSLMGRLDVLATGAVRRVGLSATIGDMAAAAAFLRPADPGRVTVVDSPGDAAPLLLQLRGHLFAPQNAPRPAGGTGGGAAERVDAAPGDMPEIADHLFANLRGADNLVFANARRDVETYADLLASRCAALGVPNEFYPHHGNLSKDVRETVERRLRSPAAPATAVCTSTLELGIDVGTVASVAQVGVPPSVAALRQRVGRSGRRTEPSVLRLYVSEKPFVDADSPVDRLRCGVVRATAMVRLMLDRWLEAADDPGFNYSTLIQQTLSVIAERGGATAGELFDVLCGPGPFRLVDESRYAALLRCMGKADLLAQTPDGLLLPGGAGERHLNHYSFYAAFRTSEEWRMHTGGRSLGSLPVSEPLRVGMRLLFAGKSWMIVDVDQRARAVNLARSPGGAAVRFGGAPAPVSGRVRGEMFTVLVGADVPRWLNDAAAELLSEGRATFSQMGLRDANVAERDGDVWLFPWAGDRALYTTVLLLLDEGLDCGVEGPAVHVLGASPERVAAHAAELLDRPWPAAAELAGTVRNKDVDKWDWVLDGDLSAEAAGARLLDMDGARTVLESAAA